MNAGSSSPSRDLGFWSLVLGALICVAPSLALAQGVSPDDATAEQKDQASQAFREGRAAFDERRFSDALSGFRTSYDVVASPNAHLMIAHSLRELGRHPEAYEAFGMVAREAEAAGEKYAETAKLAAEERENLRAKISLLSLTLPSTGAGATLTVGGRTIPTARWDEPIAVEPGRVVVVLSDGGDNLVRSVDASAGGTETLDLSTTTTEKPPVEGEDGGWRWDGTQRYAAYAVAGVGVLSLIAAAATGSAALSKHDELEVACGNAPCPDRQSDIDQGRALMNASNATLVIGVVAIGVGVTLFLTAPDDDAEAEAEVALGLGSLLVRGRF
jgi:hypothetical protein